MAKKRGCFIAKSGIGSARPVSDDDHEFFDRLEDGDIMFAEIWKERNYRFHRKFFALMKCTLENLPEDFAVRTTVEKPNKETYEHIERIDTVDKLRWHVMMQAGLYETFVTMGGKLCYQVKSISFKNMDETEFSEVYEACKNAIWKWFLPMDSEQRIIFEEQLLNY